MAWIDTVEYEDATGILKRQYDAALKRTGKIFNIVKISSLKPTVVRSSISSYISLMLESGSLSRAQREMLAVVVSRANDCFY